MRSRSRVQLGPLRSPVLPGKGGTSRKTFAPKRNPPAPLVERIERALVLAAYVVVRHGPAYAPLVDRLERELEAARQNDPTERAKHILDAYKSVMNVGATTQHKR